MIKTLTKHGSCFEAIAILSGDSRDCPALPHSPRRRFGIEMFGHRI